MSRPQQILDLMLRYIAVNAYPTRDEIHAAVMFISEQNKLYQQIVLAVIILYNQQTKPRKLVAYPYGATSTTQGYPLFNLDLMPSELRHIVARMPVINIHLVTHMEPGATH